MNDNKQLLIENHSVIPDMTLPVKNHRKRPELNENRIKKNQWLRPRLGIQFGFTALILWLGWEFVQFTGKIRSGMPADMADRPPGIEGFLPISSLMELWLFLKSGLIMAVHPAGVVILSFAIITALVMRRGFCSWLCPVGTLSEFITRLGIKIGVSWKPPRWLDIPLRGVKYFLLAFFLYAILGMSASALTTFITGGYNIVSDIKMLDYFSPPSRLTWSILAILALLTLMMKNFWCRYLCPYGALLGLLSRLSPMAIRRNIQTCIDCDLCNKVCPSYLPVATSNTVRSEECLACQQCTAVCPVKDCLQFSTKRNKLTLKHAWYGIVFLLLFLGIVGTAKFSGYWNTSTDVETYRDLAIKSDSLSHPRNINEYNK